METGPQAKARLMLETATKGELGFKLCERHYYAHVEGSQECVIQNAREFGEFLNDLPERIDEELDLLDSLVAQLGEMIGGNEVESDIEL